MGPIRWHCTKVDIPEASNDIDTKKLVVSWSNSNAWLTIKGGVIIATKMAKRCCKATNTASRNGGRSSIW